MVKLIHIAEALDTTFDDDWGAWKPRSENSCNWRRGRSRGRKQPTGPQVDHTTGTGDIEFVEFLSYLLLIEANCSLLWGQICIRGGGECLE